MFNDLLGFKSSIIEELDEVQSEISLLEEFVDRMDELKKTQSSLLVMLERIESYDSKGSKSQDQSDSVKITASSVVRSLFDSYPEKAWLPKEVKANVRDKIENGEIDFGGKTMSRNLVDNILVRMRKKGEIEKLYFDDEKRQPYYIKSSQQTEVIQS